MSPRVQWVASDSENDPCCCEPDCCMYPADGLGVDYTAADLPDAVTINWVGHLEGSASKSGSSYTSGTVTLAVNGGGTAWVLTDTSTSPASTRTVGNCLIRGDGNYTAGDDLVEDQFAASYTVNLTDTVYTTTILEIVVNRFSLCQWAGEIEVPENYWEGFRLAYDTQEHKFSISYYYDEWLGGTWHPGLGFGPVRKSATPLGVYPPDGDGTFTITSV